MMTPLLFMGELICAAVIHFLLARIGVCGPSGDVSSDQAEAGFVARTSHRLRHFVTRGFGLDLYLGSFLSALLFCYTGVASACLSYMSCVTVGTERIVFQFPNLHCDSSEYRQGLGLAVTVLIVYIIGFPLGMIEFLWRRWSLVQAANRAKSATMQLTPAGEASEDASRSHSDSSATVTPELRTFLS